MRHEILCDLSHRTWRLLGTPSMSSGNFIELNNPDPFSQEEKLNENYSRLVPAEDADCSTMRPDDESRNAARSRAQARSIVYYGGMFVIGRIQRASTLLE